MAMRCARPANGSLAGLSRAGAIARTRLTELEGLARQFVDDVNAWQAKGITDAGTAGGPLLTMTGGIATLAVTTSAIGDLALASADGTPNGNLLTLPRTADGRWRGNALEQLHGGQRQCAGGSAQRICSGSRAGQQRTQAARLRYLAVELDREAADLIRLQQAYEASARVIQVARETVPVNSGDLLRQDEVNGPVGQSLSRTGSHWPADQP